MNSVSNFREVALQRALPDAQRAAATADRRLALASSLRGVGTPTSAPVDAATASAAAGQRAVTEAAHHYGQAYRYGSVGPTRLECGVDDVRLRQARKEPAAFVHDAVQRRGGSAHLPHVGIYAGRNQMWAATQTGDLVRKQSLSREILVFGRVG